MSQKKETFQVVIDIIKNSTCFKAFTISADVPEIFMQQFWYTIKKVQGTDSYEFLLANKKCRFDVEVFRKILDICPRVKGEEFTKLQNDDDTPTFLIDLGYKRPLHKHTNMFVDHISQPWRTLVAIINKCLSGKTASNDKLRKSRIDIMWGILKFVRIGEDYQEYGLAIPDVMLNDTIKQSESYQMFIKYSTGQIPSKKIRGKGSQGKKTVDISQETVDVSEESKPEPAKKKTASRRVVKKKVIISTDDNIIPDSNVAFELGKSISSTEAAEKEAERQVHASHERIVTESIPKSTRRRPSGIAIRETSQGSNKKLKDVQPLTLEEQEAADIMQALIESKKTSKRQQGTRGSSEGTGTIPGVPDESTVVSATSSEGTDTKPGVSNEEKKDDKDDEIYKYKIHVHKDVDADMEELKNVEHENKEKDVITDAAKLDVEKHAEETRDAEKATGSKFQVKDSTEFPLPSSSLSGSSGFGAYFFNSSSDISLAGILKDTAEADVPVLVIL
ncbi:hypothetical protein Tco_1020427, partial [Tanacetum coccineum]